MKHVIRLSSAVALGIAACAFTPAVRAQEHPPTPEGSAYYSAQRPYDPPFPMNRFPKLPTYEVHPKIFVIDDRGVDYGDGNMTMTSSIEPPPIPGPGGGEPQQPPFIAPTVPIFGVPLLRIEIIEGGVKRLLFDSEPGIVYRLEESTDLSAGVWNTLETIVATDTQTRFLTPENSMAFYRVIKGATAIQFPDWHDSIEQFLYFDVYSPVVGTYGLEL